MDNEEIKKELSLCKRISKLPDETVLQYIREDIQERLTELQSQLEEEKPKLRHLDYGIGRDGNFRVTLLNQNGEYFSAGQGCCMSESASKQSFPETNILNLIDDFKAMSEDLEEFELDIHKYYIDKIPEMSYKPIHIAGNWHNLAELSNHILNLRRLEATFIRKAKAEAKMFEIL